MPNNYEGYQTTDTDWIDGVLQDSNTVKNIKGFLDGVNDRVIACTDTGVCTIYRGIMHSPALLIKTGWLDQANVNSVAWDDTYLYVAHGTDNTNGDIGRIALATLFDKFDPTAITQANPGQVTVTGHGLANGDEAHFQEIGGMTELNGQTGTVTVVDADNFTIGIDTSGFTAFTSGGTISYRDADAYTPNFGSANGMFHDSGTYMTADIASAQVDSTWYIMYPYNTPGGNWASGMCIDLGLFKPSSSDFFRSWYLGGVGTDKVCINESGWAFGARGGCVWGVDTTQITASDWDPDAAWGNFDDDFVDGTVATLAGALTLGSVTATESAGKLNLSLTASGDPDSIAVFGGHWAGDFTYELTGLGGTNPSIVSSGDLVNRTVDFKNINGDRLLLETYFFWDVTSARVEWEIRKTVKVAGSTVQTATVNMGAAPSAASADSYKIKITRSGQNVSFHYDTTGGWTEIGSSYASFPADIPLLESRNIALWSLNGSSVTWSLSEMINSNPETSYSSFGNLIDITGIDADRSPLTSTNYFGVSYDGDGAYLVMVSTSAPEDSTVYSYGTSGKDYNILTSDNCSCIALDQTAAQINIWVGTFAYGIDYINVPFGTAANINSTTGKTIDDQITSIFAIDSCVYGTGSGAVTQGAGYLNDVVSVAPEDVEVAANCWKDGNGYVHVELSWLLPEDSDWNHSRVYHRVNGGAWNYFASNETWVTSGNFYEFSGGINLLAMVDKELQDAKHEYKITQIDDGGYESGGTVVTCYIDEPVVSVSIAGGSSYTDVPGIQLSITGDSGDDSGNESGQVDKLRIKQQGSVESLILVPLGNPPWLVPFHLEGTAGGKTVQVWGYDQAGQEGSLDEVIITYDPAESTQTTYDSKNNIMIAHKIKSDDASLSAGSEYSDYLVDNLKDRRLAKVWRGNPVWGEHPVSSLEAYYNINIAFSQAEKIDAFFLTNHNLGSNYVHDGNIWLCASDSSASTSWTPQQWVLNADYTVELENILGKQTIVHRPERSYRYWSVVIYVYATYNLFQPFIGRVGLIRSEDIWQPGSNMDLDYQREIADQSTILESDELAYESVERGRRNAYRIKFSNLSDADYRTAKSIFEYLGRTSDLFVMIRPDEFQTGTTAPQSGVDWAFDPLYCQISKNLVLHGKTAGKASFELALREIVGNNSMVK